MRAKGSAKTPPAPPAALTYEDVLRIVEVVKASQFSEFRLKLGETEVHLRRKNGAAAPAAPAAAAPSVPASAVGSAAASWALPSDAEPDIPEGAHAVRAPMVGTFYCAPAPGAKPFVEVGDEVDADTTVGIIEVMKLMNSIPAGVRGVVRAVLVANAQYVEYGQPIVLIEARA
jgi:acetyl-CoA carboxylase biotin carboxyl carrier protein